MEEMLGQGEAAASLYLQAFEQGERREGDVSRLVQQLRNRRQLAEASRVLRKCELLGLQEAVTAMRPEALFLFPLPPATPRPLPPALARLGCEIALELRDFARAVVLAIQAVSPNPVSHRDALWLADVYAQAGQSLQAVGVLEHLVERSPQLADGWVALVRQLVKAGQHEKAEDVLVKAQRKLSAAGEFWQLPVAQCYEALGKIPLAERHYRLALQAMPDNPLVLRPLARFHLANDRPEDALPILHALIHSPHTSSHHAAWARRMAASLPFQLLTLGRPLSKPPSEQELLSLLGANADSPTDQRIKALVLAIQPGRAGEALALFRQTVTPQAPLSPEEQLRLVQLSDLAGERNQADDLMDKLLNSRDVTAQVIAAQVRRLMGRGDNGEAGQRLNQLRKLEPDAKRTRDLQQALADL